MGQPGWKVAGHVHTRCLSSEQPDQDRGDGHDDERRGYGGREMPKQQHGGERQDAGQRPIETSGRCCKTCQSFVKKLPDAPLIPSRCGTWPMMVT